MIVFIACCAHTKAVYMATRLKYGVEAWYCNQTELLAAKSKAVMSSEIRQKCNSIASSTLSVDP